MRLVHKKAINTQLLKGDNIILAAVSAQFFQLGFQRFRVFSICLILKFSPAWAFSSLMAASVS